MHANQASAQPVPIFSIYCRPSKSRLNEIMQEIFSNQNLNMDTAVLCMDSNAHDPLQNSSFSDQKGRKLFERIVDQRLPVANILKENLELVPGQTTFVDVTLVGLKTSNIIINYFLLNLKKHNREKFTIGVKKQKNKNDRQTFLAYKYEMTMWSVLWV